MTGGVVLALAAVATVLFTSDDTSGGSISYGLSETPANTLEPKKSVDNATIDYTQEETPAAYGNAVAAETAKATVEEKWDPAIETKAYDTTRTFEISVVNPNRDPEHTAKAYVPVSGRIDGRHFVMKVPEYLIKENSSGISIQIKNLNTGKVSTTSISFMDELKDRTRSAHLNIDSNDVDNYEYVSEEKMLPVPGERYVGN